MRIRLRKFFKISSYFFISFCFRMNKISIGKWFAANELQTKPANPVRSTKKPFRDVGLCDFSVFIFASEKCGAWEFILCYLCYQMLSSTHLWPLPFKMLSHWLYHHQLPRVLILLLIFVDFFSFLSSHSPNIIAPFFPRTYIASSFSF